MTNCNLPINMIAVNRLFWLILIARQALGLRPNMLEDMCAPHQSYSGNFLWTWRRMRTSKWEEPSMRIVATVSFNTYHNLDTTFMRCSWWLLRVFSLRYLQDFGLYVWKILGDEYRRLTALWNTIEGSEIWSTGYHAAKAADSATLKSFLRSLVLSA